MLDEVGRQHLLVGLPRRAGRRAAFWRPSADGLDNRWSAAACRCHGVLRPPCSMGDDRPGWMTLGEMKPWHASTLCWPQLHQVVEERSRDRLQVRGRLTRSASLTACCRRSSTSLRAT